MALSFTPSTTVVASAVPTESAGLAAGLANAALEISACSAITALTAGHGSI